MTIAYIFENNLYINVTNRCTNSCDFCIRTQADGFYSDDLWLEREPSVEEIIKDVTDKKPDTFSSVVFCGYGEPTVRLDDVISVARELKSRYSGIKLRINTNGQSDLIHGRNTAPDFSVFDAVSISLNSTTPKGYDEICHSIYGEDAFGAILTFAKNVKDYAKEVTFSVVRGSISELDIEKCKEVAETCGITLRIREYIKNS